MRLLVTLGEMILLDLRRPFQIAAMRRQASGFGQIVRSVAEASSRPAIRTWSESSGWCGRRRRSPSASCFSPRQNGSFTFGT